MGRVLGGLIGVGPKELGPVGNLDPDDGSSVTGEIVVLRPEVEQRLLRGPTSASLPSVLRKHLEGRLILAVGIRGTTAHHDSTVRETAACARRRSRRALGHAMLGEIVGIEARETLLSSSDSATVDEIVLHSVASLNESRVHHCEVDSIVLVDGSVGVVEGRASASASVVGVTEAVCRVSRKPGGGSIAGHDDSLREAELDEEAVWDADLRNDSNTASIAALPASKAASVLVAARRKLARATTSCHDCIRGCVSHEREGGSRRVERSVTERSQIMTLPWIRGSGR